jgi:hypothetical protein
MKIEKNVYADNKSVRLDSSIYDHIAWLYEHILKYPYRQQQPIEGIARPIHGIAHMARVALLGKCILEFYRYHNDIDALNIAERQLKLISLTCAWHDSGRENDAKDYWDEDSAINLYCYLTITLEIPHEEAKIYAEAIYNKDAKDKFFELSSSEEGKITWVESSREAKNIIEKVLHDADCYDIIRVRAIFDKTELDIYKQFVKNAKENSSVKQSLTEIDYIINEVSSLIEIEGDGFGRLNFKIKLQYESKQAYQLIEADLENNFHILALLYHKNKLYPAEELKELKLFDNSP